MPNNGCERAPIEFYVKCDDWGYSINNYKWLFYDKNNVDFQSYTMPNVVYLYDTFGVYKVEVSLLTR
jgi:hypothetical protein